MARHPWSNSPFASVVFDLAVPMLHPVWGDAHLWTGWLRATGASPGTIRLRSHFIDDFADTNPDPWVVTVDDVVAYIGRQGWAPETRKSARASLRSFYRWALASGRMTSDPTAMCPPVRVPAGIPRPTPEAVVADAIVRADDETRLMLLLAAYAGLRLGEISRVHSRDVTDQGLRVEGKGGRVRVVPIHPRLRDSLDELDGWAFPSRGNSRSKPGDHVQVDYIARRVCALLGPGWSTHTLRHRFATRAYAASHDLRSVQSLLGHSKPETTARYVAVAHDDLAAAVNAVA